MFNGITLLAALSALTAHDFCYYRCTGRGETFAMQTAALTMNAASRAKFWAKVSSDKMPVIYQLTFPKKEGWKQKLPETPEAAIKAIDAFFAPGDGVEPCPDRLFAVTPCEENVTWDGQLAVQDAIAKHLKAKYGVKTYQWLSEPLMPTLAMQADGWVFDAYCVTDPVAFRSHLEGFLLTGVPVVPCLWGSGRFCNYHKAKTWEELTRFTVERMDICRSFDLPLVMFCVAGKMGSAGLWFKDPEDADEKSYRDALKGYLAAVPTASRPQPKRILKKWLVAVREDGRAEGMVDLCSFGLVRETMFEDVCAWRLTDQGLSLVGAEERLAWWMFSSGSIRKGRYTLRHSPGAKGTFGGVPLSADGVTTIEATAFDDKKLVLNASGPIVLKSLEFKGEGEYKVVDVGLDMDTSYGRTDYRRMISFFSDEAKLGAKKGHVETKRVVRKISLPGCAGRFIVDAAVKAYRAYASSVCMRLSLDGKTPIAESATDPAKQGAQKLSIIHLLREGAESAFLVFDIKVSCGVDIGGVTAAEVLSCDFKFRPEHP